MPDASRLNVDICFLHNTPDCAQCQPKPARCQHGPGDGCYNCCSACNYDMHACPGCGTDVPHGTVACAACSQPGHVDLDPVATAWYQAILGWDAQIAELEAKRARAVEHIQAAMGDAPEARVDGKPVVTWKASKPGKRLDRKLLEDKLGADVVAEFLVESRPARPFRILGGHDE